MNSTVFYLNDEKTDYVAIKWDDGWKNTIVYRNKEKIGEIPTKEDLKFGKPIRSTDGKIIYIKLKGAIFGKPYLELLIDGNSYDYKEPSPEDKIHKIFKIILTIAGINVILGLLGALLNIPAINNLGFGYSSVIFGFVFLGLGLAFRYKKSLLAVLVMAIIILLELVYYIKIISQNDIEYIIDNNLKGILTRIVLVIIFIRGGIYIVQYRRENINAS
jgi:hypothetical protein